MCRAWYSMVMNWRQCSTHSSQSRDSCVRSLDCYWDDERTGHNCRGSNRMLQYLLTCPGAWQQLHAAIAAHTPKCEAASACCHVCSHVQVRGRSESTS